MLLTKKSYLTLLFTTIISLCCAQHTTRFALITDTHIAHNDTLTSQHLQQITQHINSVTDVDFVIITGDITQHADTPSLLLAKQILDKLDMPYYVIAGNHDYHNGSNQLFKQVFGNDRFYFLLNNTAFIGCSAMPLQDTSEGIIADTTWRWIEQQLHSTSKTILFTHYPIQAGDIHNADSIAQRLAQMNINLIASGHYHRYMLTACLDIPNLIHRAPIRTGDNTIGYTLYEIKTNSINIYEHICGREPNLWITLPW